MTSQARRDNPTGRIKNPLLLRARNTHCASFVSCYRGRSGDATPRSSHQNGRADFPHPAFQSAFCSLYALVHHCLDCRRTLESIGPAGLFISEKRENSGERTRPRVRVSAPSPKQSSPATQAACGSEALPPARGGAWRCPENAVHSHRKCEPCGLNPPTKPCIFS